LPWDVFARISDGFVETTDSHGQEFGLARVEWILAERAHGPLEDVWNVLAEETSAFGPVLCWCG
jgi:hypothetical protein